MLPNTSVVDPWIRAISLLCLPDGSESVDRKSIHHATCNYYAESKVSECRPYVRVIERPTPQTVTLDWRDSTNCCYREQLWVAARSRVSARCAMSGAPISPGDDIFRPRPTRPAPRNVGAMILASVLEACYRRGSAFEYATEAPCADEGVAGNSLKPVLATYE